MANTYNAPYFDVDTSTDVAGLTTLKGGVPSSTDILHVHNTAILDVDEDMSILWTYLGDNQTGDASVKEGHIIVRTNVTLTYYHTTNDGGLYGEGLTSTYILDGTDANNRATIAGNVQKPGIYFMLQPTCIFNFGHVYNFRSAIGSVNFSSTFIDCLIENALYGFRFAGGVSRSFLPASMLRTKFKNCSSSIIDFSVTGMGSALETYFTEQDIICEGGIAQESNFNMGYGSSGGAKSKHIYYFEYDNSIVIAPSWSSTTGLQALVANSCLGLAASWNGATDDNSLDVFYRIYIKEAADPNTFGKDSVYFLAETADTSFIIAADATGSVLVEGTTYYVIVKAATKYSEEDSNTTALTAEADLTQVIIDPVCPISATVEKDISIIAEVTIS